jgi:hypothetical protein
VYQWQRCNRAGRRCRAIRGAVGKTYRLTSADVGHRIRVVEWAYNISGAGSPRISRETRVVHRRRHGHAR